MAKRGAALLLGEPVDQDQPDFGDLDSLPDDPNAVWLVYRLRSKEELAAFPEGGKYGYLTRFAGKPDLEHLRERVGGGSFYLRPRVAGLFQGSVRVDIDGPAYFRLGDPPRPPPLDPGTTQQVPELEPRLRRIEELLGQRPDPLPDLLRMVSIMKELLPPAAPSPAPPDVGQVIELIHRGIEIGQGRDPESGGLPPWVEKLAPLLLSVFPSLTGNGPARRPGGESPPPPVAANPPTPLPAEIESPAEVAGCPVLPAVLWEYLGRAIDRHVEPVDAADTVLEILTADEARRLIDAPLRPMTAGVLRLRPDLVLSAEPYVRSFLAGVIELTTPSRLASPAAQEPPT